MLNFIKKVLSFIKKLFGFKDKEKPQELPRNKSKVSCDYKSAFDINYWQKYVSDGFMIRQDVAHQIAKDIMVNLVHNSPENKHHEIKIINYLERTATKSHISIIAFLFQKLYSKNLLEEIKKSFDKDSFKKMVDTINKLPD